MGKYQGKSDNGEEEQQEEDKYKARKLPLQFILLPPENDQHSEKLVEFDEILFRRSECITKLSYLASHLFLFKVKTALENDDRVFFEDNGVPRKRKKRNGEEFTIISYEKGEKVIRECFQAVSIGNIANQRLMPAEYRQMVEEQCNQQHFKWPDKKELGNSFGYAVDMHVTNTRTNLRVHGEKRLRKFVKIRAYQFNKAEIYHIEFDQQDQNNVIDYVMNSKDRTANDIDRIAKMNLLLDELEIIGWVRTIPMRLYIKKHWLESLRLFGKIQQAIDEFKSGDVAEWHELNRNRRRNDPARTKKPPNIENFALVPLCDYHLKHIRIDIRDCYNLMSKLKLLPKVKNPDTNRWNQVSQTHYRKHPAELWGLLFDMEKIDAAVGPKNKFHAQIVTDSVSASIVFTPKSKSKVKTEPQPLDSDVYKGIEQEIGIDPGMKLYLAVVRIDLTNNVEVSKY